MDNRPIGIFDSGIGGLTGVDSISKSLPHESIHYVGDTARVPYGNKSMERVQQFSKEITQWLVNHECKIIIIACNTASSLALDFLRSEFDIPIIGVIQPGALVAVGHNSDASVGLQARHAPSAAFIFCARVKTSSVTGAISGSRFTQLTMTSA